MSNSVESFVVFVGVVGLIPLPVDGNHIQPIENSLQYFVVEHIPSS